MPRSIVSKPCGVIENSIVSVICEPPASEVNSWVCFHWLSGPFISSSTKENRDGPSEWTAVKGRRTSP
ncbi:hypothetical protein IOD13_00430 [Brevibacterium casei]|nr:hypothetical protein [Brevibacterium casei]